ncbi:MAG: helix-turn-helix domain-containing protein [Oscillospiraceae bacterium]|nr:helix-turn-helix domain-containing protein [Oscillospiraceae bacterium]
MNKVKTQTGMSKAAAEQYARGFSYFETELGSEDKIRLGKIIITKAHKPMPNELHEDQFELLYVYSGVKVIYLKDKRIVMKGGEAAIISPDTTHGAEQDTQNRSTLYYLIFQDPAASANFLNLSQNERNSLSALLDKHKDRVLRTPPDFRESFERLLKVAALPETELNLKMPRIRFTVFYIMWKLLEFANCNGFMIPEDIQSAIDYIRKAHSVIPSLEQLSALIHLSMPRFKQKFKRAVGVPPAEFILREKIAESIAMIIETDNSITSISQSLGFCSSQHFSTVFKKYTGASPMQYRKSGRQANPPLKEKARSLDED